MVGVFAHHQGNKPWYPLEGGVGCSQSQSGFSG